jgi:hypothetical protein
LLASLNATGTAQAINFRQFSGYLSIGNTKYIHYWFVESQRDPKNDPLVFWTNGGTAAVRLVAMLAREFACTKLRLNVANGLACQWMGGLQARDALVCSAS